MNKIKVMTFVGTRPEIIKLSSIIKLLDQFVNHILVHTRQNYDYELSDIFFDELGLRKPDHFFNLKTSSAGAAVGSIIAESEQILLKEKPDAILVLGDTNTCLSAYMAKRMHIPIYHMEAGNRCFDFSVPEEINRRMVDHIADYNLVHTEHARRHLLAEGLPHNRIYLTGSPMYEVLKNNENRIKSSRILSTLKLKANSYFIVSVHREENVDNHAGLCNIIDILNSLAEQYNLPVIVSTHPRTRQRLEKVKDFKSDARIQFLKPFGFMDYVHLQMEARCSISDSGTISEESSILNFPAVTLRNSIERPEALDAGTIITTGLDKEIILNSINSVIEEFKIKKYNHIPHEYQIKNTSWRVLKLILGTIKLSK